MTERFLSLQQRYRSGDLPWDQPLPPPEVLTEAERLPAGRALDLGCGSGRAAIFLARNGWIVDGVDFVPEAIALAQARAAEAGVADRVSFTVGSVSALNGCAGPYDFALDVGCLHGLPADELPGYTSGLAQRLRPGAIFLLFSHLGDGSADSRWISAETLRRAMSNDFTLLEWTDGETFVGADHWPSAWSRWQRRP